MAAPRDVYMVNYFPVVNGGYSMWTNYNGAQYQADMVVAKNLGFDTLRIIVPNIAGGFEFPSPTVRQLANFTDLYNRAKAVGVRLHYCFFDNFSSYGKVHSSQTLLTNLLNALPDFTAVQAVELQNEQRFGLASTAYSLGYDSGWTASQTGLTDGQIQLEWARKMILFLRASYPSLLIALSTGPGGRFISNYASDLQAGVTALAATAAAPDWWEPHLYVTSGLEFTFLQSLLAIAGDANVYIGEFGVNTVATSLQTQQQINEAQADYMKATRSACAVLGLPEPAPWLLFDVLPCTQYPSGNVYGLYDSTGALKPAGQLYVDTPPGALPPPADINSGMRGFQLSYGQNLPLRWNTVLGNDGTQPITAMTDLTARYQDNPMVLLTGSAGSSANGAQPSFSSEVGALLPAVSPGQTYSFSVALKGTGSNGTPRLNISWYSKTGYISGTNGPVLSLTSSIQTYSISSVAPAQSLYARLSVVTSNNAGNIWMGGAQWSGPGSRIGVRSGHWLRRTTP